MRVILTPALNYLNFGIPFQMHIPILLHYAISIFTLITEDIFNINEEYLYTRFWYS